MVINMLKILQQTQSACTLLHMHSPARSQPGRMMLCHPFDSMHHALPPLQVSTSPNMCLLGWHSQMHLLCDKACTIETVTDADSGMLQPSCSAAEASSPDMP